MRTCKKRAKDILRYGFDKLVNQNKEFYANLNELKRQPSNSLGRMLPKYITT